MAADAVRMVMRDAPAPRPVDQALLPAILPDLAAAIGARGVRLLVHGSRARGEARPSSDIDIAVLSDAEKVDWAADEAIRDACSAHGVRPEICHQQYLQPEFLERIRPDGIEIVAGLTPCLPAGWPPVPDAWTDDPATAPAWVSRPVRHAHENIVLAADHFAAAAETLPAGAELRLAGLLATAPISDGCQATARAVRRIMALLGERIDGGDPADDGSGPALIGRATRVSPIWGLPGPRRLRPAFAPEIRGDLRSLAEAAAANREECLTLPEMLPDCISAAAGIARSLPGAFRRWLVDLQAPAALLDPPVRHVCGERGQTAIDAENGAAAGQAGAGT
jgi:hypothetical protein